MRHQLFLTLRADSDRDVGELDTHAWSSVTALSRALDWTVLDHRTRTGHAGVTVTSVATDRDSGPITITTFWRHACALVDIPPAATCDPRVTEVVVENEFTGPDDITVVAGASHPVGGHMTSVYEVLWCENTRRHWERADLGATLEELD
ncbi:hypothetical protein ACQ7HM_07245 [Williamsia sp. MIQD14]|uniref:hypothetical protein n=1 Tax=Williamsia sp. MIQD14 TaxID=3425703 RepID=UPI003DA0411B